MIKRTLIPVVILILCILTVSCGGGANESSEPLDESKAESVAESTAESATEGESDGNSEEESAASDTIPPAFVDANNGKLPAVSHNACEEFDILNGITVRDNVTADADIVITVSDDGGYKNDVAGKYTVTLEAKDSSGNTATATLEITVNAVSVATVIKLGGDIPYVVNDETALEYTPSGTKFRSSDVVQVMEKDFFIKQYNAVKADHTNNGNVPYFPYGVVVITDKNYNIVQLRSAAGTAFQIESDGTVATSGFNWTFSLDAANGGGLFKGIVEDLDDIIPVGGYVIFTANAGDALCRTYLIQNLIFSGYVSGAVAPDQIDIDITAATIELD
jgi:hypothetical protein